MSIGCPEHSTMRTQARSDCGHCSNGLRAVVDQSNARILAPISPPPANTDSINCVLMRSMAESLDLASALSDVHNRIHLLSLVRRRIVVGKAADERRAGHRVPTKQQSSNTALAVDDKVTLRLLRAPSIRTSYITAYSIAA